VNTPSCGAGSVVVVSDSPGAWRSGTVGLSITSSRPSGLERSAITRVFSISRALLRPLKALTCGVSHVAGHSHAIAAPASARASARLGCGTSSQASAEAAKPLAVITRRPSASGSANMSPIAAAAPRPAPTRSAAYSRAICASRAMNASPMQVAAKKNGTLSNKYSSARRSAWPGFHTSSRPLNGTRCAAAKHSAALSANPAAQELNSGRKRLRAALRQNANTLPLTP
jgi:hypothetical protein